MTDRADPFASFRGRRTRIVRSARPQPLRIEPREGHVGVINKGVRGKLEPGWATRPLSAGDAFQQALQAVRHRSQSGAPRW